MYTTAIAISMKSTWCYTENWDYVFTVTIEIGMVYGDTAVYKR